MPGAPHDAEIDARGLLCPLPLVLASKRIVGEPSGFRLVVLADDPAAPGDFREWERSGAVTIDEVEEIEAPKRVFRIAVRKH